MRYAKWFDSRASRPRIQSRQSRRYSTPRLEALEDRITPSTLIPVSNHSDLVFDAGRDILYITTTAGQVQRWDVATQQLLSSWTVGGSLAGADITPDDNSLYVAEEDDAGPQGFFDQVDLQNGIVTDASYNNTSIETDSWDIAIGVNGNALVSTLGTFAYGPLPVPLRELDTTTNTYSYPTNAPGYGGPGLISEGTTIARSADRSLFLVTEANIPTGPFFLYYPNTNSYSSSATSNVNLKGTSPVVNRNGSLLALEVSGGASVFDRNFNSVQNLSGLTGGLFFDPNQDVLYGVNPTTDLIYAYDTNTWALKYTMPVGETIGASSDFGTGVMAVSADGQYLFLTTSTGVREYLLPQATGVASSLTVSGFPQFITNGNTGTVQVTAKDPAGNVVTNYTGTVQFTSTSTGSLPADYTFTASDQGTHTFTLTLTTSGTQSLIVTDQVYGLTGSETGIVVHDFGTNYIPIANYRDLVYDPTRYVLYITTSDGLVQRYNPYTETLLAPYQVGNRLEGAEYHP